MKGPVSPVALLVLGAGLSAEAQTWPRLVLDRAVSGISQPIGLASAGDSSGRMFVLQQTGQVRIVRNGALVSTPFLDIAAKVSCCSERGLLGIAFPPGFAASRRFYVNYTDRNGNTVVARYRVPQGTPDVADATSEQILLSVTQPFANHNGGHLAFGPDGYLYIGLGDGGSGGDPQNNAQNRAVLLGKMLRIDVEGSFTPYGVPSTNPFVTIPGVRPEIWAYGLRNPWRYSFDRETGDLYIADVGQNLYEEVNFQPASSRGGENYGWRIMEGLHCYNASSCSMAGLVNPVVEYSHSLGCSVTGGYVYRGRSYPRLRGIYLFADYCSGRIFGIRQAGDRFEGQELLDSPYTITTFGEDESGELWLADSGGNALYRVRDDAGASATRLVPVVLDAPGRFGARFTSELVLANRGTTLANVTATYVPSTALGASGGGTVSETLPAGRQLVFTDALAWLRGKGLQIPTSGSQGGTLRLVFDGLSSADAAYAAARTTTASGAGRAGLSYEAPRVETLPTTGAVRIFGLRGTGADRSNLALVNAGTAGEITLRLVAIGPDGTEKPLPDVRLAAGQFTQLNDVLAEATLFEGSVRVSRASGTEPFLAYGVVNDNATGDGSFIAQVAEGRAAGTLLLPVLVETATFESELVLANPSTKRVTATLTYVESLARAGAPTSVTENLAPGQQLIVPSALDYLRARGAAIGTRGESYAGTLRVTLQESGGALVEGFAGARTAAVSTAGGRYGLFYPALAETETAATEAWVYGLRQDSAVRSNLAGLNTAGTTASTLRYEIFDGATGQSVATREMPSLLPAGWTQVNSVLTGTGVQNAYVKVTRVSGSQPFVVYGVVNDGATNVEGTSDGSYVGMSR